MISKILSTLPQAKWCLYIILCVFIYRMVKLEICGVIVYVKPSSFTVKVSIYKIPVLHEDGSGVRGELNVITMFWGHL